MLVDLVCSTAIAAGTTVEAAELVETVETGELGVAVGAEVALRSLRPTVIRQPKTASLWTQLQPTRALLALPGQRGRAVLAAMAETGTVFAVRNHGPDGPPGRAGTSLPVNPTSCKAPTILFVPVD